MPAYSRIQAVPRAWLVGSRQSAVPYPACLDVGQWVTIRAEDTAVNPMEIIKQLKEIKYQ